MPASATQGTLAATASNVIVTASPTVGATPTSSPDANPTALVDPLVACVGELAPAASPSAGSPVNGQPQANMGNGHVQVGTPVRYESCPPASGQHYSSTGLGPIAPRFYGPGDRVLPQGWVHNLEHGGLVILYNCALGGCDPVSMEKLRTLASTFPASPRCGIPGGFLSPVIARFDQMQGGFAALVWDRVLLQAALDTDQLLAFFRTVGETTNPEQYCAP